MKTYEFAVSQKERLGELVTTKTRLTSEIVAKLFEYGAVQVRFRGVGAWNRVRDPRYKASASDRVKIVHDSKVLTLAPFVTLTTVASSQHYSVYIKPANVMAQGTDAGDHCSLLFAVEKQGKGALPIHRLDRETEGLMVVAHNPKAAAELSRLFQEHKVEKTYMAIVAGATSFLGVGTSGSFDDPLDGKAAKTLYEVLGELTEGRLLLRLKPVTGRLHQIRRHLELVDCGVWGDPKYGKGNKNREGMKLAASALSFQDPWKREQVSFTYQPSFCLNWPT